MKHTGAETMKPMTKERLEALREKCTSDYLTFLEGNEIMDEIHRLRGALEMVRRVSECSKAFDVADEALSPSDETEVTK